MSHREHIWTVVFAVLFTLLIWLWAEGENRESSTESATAVFAATNQAGEFRIRTPDPSNPSNLVSEIDLQLVVEGSNIALQRLGGKQRFEIPIDNAADGMTREIDLVDAVRNLQDLADFGLTVTAVNPPTVTLHIDQIERRSVPISTTIPGIAGISIDEITIEPREVELSMSRSDWQWATEQFGRDLVYLDIDPASLRDLAPGVPVRRQNVRVRLQPQVQRLDLVGFEPPLVSVSMTLQQQLEELADWPVPVKINTPIRDEPFYEVIVDLEYELITGVTLAGDADAIRRLRDNQIKVRAVVDLSSDDLEQGITEKQIEWWLPPGIQVISVGGAPASRPIIPIRIIRQGDSESESHDTETNP
jgi:hypothetical protein